MLPMASTNIDLVLFLYAAWEPGRALADLGRPPEAGSRRR